MGPRGLYLMNGLCGRREVTSTFRQDTSLLPPTVDIKSYSQALFLERIRIFLLCLARQDVCMAYPESAMHRSTQLGWLCSEYHVSCHLALDP